MRRHGPVAAGIPASGTGMAEAVATMAISDIKRGQEESSQHAEDGLVPEGPPDGIDGL
jgi:hypothetical protein